MRQTKQQPKKSKPAAQECAVYQPTDEFIPVMPQDPLDVSSLRVMFRSREITQKLRKGLANQMMISGAKEIKKDEHGNYLPYKKQNVADRPVNPLDEKFFLDLYNETLAKEQFLTAALKKKLEAFPIYRHYLKHVEGLGEVGSAAIITMLNPHAARHVSSMWQHAGLNPDVVLGHKRVQTKNPKTYKPDNKDWVVVKRGKDFVIVRTNITVPGDKLTSEFVAPYNKRLKTCLLGVTGACVIKAGLRHLPCTDEEYNATHPELRALKDLVIDGVRHEDVKCLKHPRSPLGAIYLERRRQYRSSKKAVTGRKKKKTGEPVYWETTSDKHVLRACTRYVIKQLLVPVYVVWRRLEGLEYSNTYHQDVLGHPVEHRILTGVIEQAQSSILEVETDANEDADDMVYLPEPEMEAV